VLQQLNTIGRGKQAPNVALAAGQAMMAKRNQPVRFQFELPHAQGLIIAMVQWIQSFALPGSNRDPTGTRIRLQFPPEAGFTTPLRVSAHALWSRFGQDVRLEHENRPVVIAVSSSGFMTELLVSDEELRANLDESRRRRGIETAINPFVPGPSPMIARPLTKDSGNPIKKEVERLTGDITRWFDELFINYQRHATKEQRQQLAQVIPPQAALLMMRHSLVRQELAVKRRSPNPDPKIREKNERELEFNEGVITLTNIQINFLLRVLTDYYLQQEMAILPGAEEQAGILMPPGTEEQRERRGDGAGGDGAGGDGAGGNGGGIAAGGGGEAGGGKRIFLHDLPQVNFGDLRIVYLSDPELQHPRYQFHIGIGCELVLITADGRFYLFIRKAEIGITVSIEPTRKLLGHHALAVFSAGTTDAPSKRWLIDAKLSRSQLRQAGKALPSVHAPSLLGYIDHETEEVDGAVFELWQTRVRRLLGLDQ